MTILLSGYKAQRNAEIYRQGCQGRTLREISEAYGLCRDRVSQIIRKEHRLRGFGFFDPLPEPDTIAPLVFDQEKGRAAAT